MQVHEYSVDLDVDATGERFRGTARIAITATEPVVELDAAGLDIQRAEVDGAPAGFASDVARQKIVIPTPEVGDRLLRLDYTGVVRRDVTNGFYVSRFGSGKLLTTMMQPLGCRWLFPCVDHPAQKAVLRLTVSTDPGLTVIANADVEAVEDRKGRRVWRFAPTPRMSTYLVYLGIGPFDRATADHDGIRVTVATAPGKAAEASRALSLAGPVLRGYEEYYGLPYPLRKLDLVAVPDFWAGGMENWGAITFPELGLLWGDSTSPAVVRWAVETLSHEIAHQWFGNLVTMEWWNDIWLNESFATFVAAKMTHVLGLRRDAWAEFLIRTSPGYFVDSLRATHPIKFEVEDPATVSQSVDEITYFKGANIVRMLEAYLGEEAFRRGVASYLARFQFRNARDQDLWESLEGASGQPVRRVMGAWVDRPGLPVIEVRPSRDGFRLAQRRFTYLPADGAEAPWPIPLTYRVGGSVERRLFDGRELDLRASPGEDLLLNPGRSAFVRVWFEPGLRDRMIARLSDLPPFDRWAYLSDAFAFLLSGDLSLPEYLASMKAARGSADYPSVAEALGSLHALRPILAESPGFDAEYGAFHRAQWERLGSGSRPGEPDTDPVLRELVAAGLARMDPEFGRPLAEHFADLESVPAPLRPAAAIAYARSGASGVVDGLFDRIRSQVSEDTAQHAAFAVGALPTAVLLTEALDRLQGPGVRTLHVGYIVRAVAVNPLGRAAAWSWMRANLRDFEKKTEGSWGLSVLLQTALPHAGLGREEEVREFFARESFPEGSNGVARGLEMLEILGRVRSRAGMRG